MNKVNKIILIGGIIVIIGGGIFYTQYQKQNEPIFCTMEAKICPDGSSVGRIAPKCEFALCPEPLRDGWNNFIDDVKGVSFQYPEKILAQYISVLDWPPKVEIIDESFTCIESGSDGIPAGKTIKKYIYGRNYCVTEETEGAAGSLYSQYAYATEIDGKTAIFTFSLKSTQCDNYDMSQKAVCESERASFNVDPIIIQIISTFKYQK